MYQEELLIDYIKAHSSFTSVELAEEKNIYASSDTSNLTKIYVGHIGCKIADPSDLSANGYDEIQNPQLLLTQILFICDRSLQTQVYHELQASVVDFTPYPDNSSYGNILFVEANLAAKTGKKVWWDLTYAVQFPRIS